MVTKYLSNFYSYKWISDFISPPGGAVTPEEQMRSYLSRGHDHFFKGRYQDALKSYQTAYSLAYRLLHPNFPYQVGALYLPDLGSIRITDHLIMASTEIARYRDAAGSRTIISPADPPKELTALVDLIGRAGTSDLPSEARSYYSLAVDYLRMGALRQAEAFLKRSAEANIGQPDRLLEADLSAAAGMLAIERDPETAQALLTRASQQYERLGLRSEQAAVNNNLGVLYTMTGNGRQAGAAFQAAGDNQPLDLGRTMTQPLNPGTATSMSRPMGSRGLEVILRTSNDWVTVPAALPQNPGARQLGVLVEDRVVSVDLQLDAAAGLVEKVYKPRVTAATLEALKTLEFMPFNFVAYLAHIHGFTLPMSIGDCYTELGEYARALLWYLKARDYTYLNVSIEAPAVWIKMARAYLKWAHQTYKGGDTASAKALYEMIARLTEPALDPASPLYDSPVFDGMKAQVQAMLTAPTPLDPDVHNPAVAEVVFTARLNLQNIEAGIDLPLLSLEREEVPVFTFEYLQNVARYFAEHAVSAERTYISFKTSAENEEFTRSMLENAVNLETASEMLEQKKLEIAREQKEAVDANTAYAQRQLDNAVDLKNEYGTVSLQEIALDSEITYVGAPTTEYEFSGYGEYGISDGTHRADEVLRTLTRRRREISRGFELHNLDRRISELDAALTVAQRQQAVAGTQVEAAMIQSQIATMRRQQAEQQLALFDSEEFTPDLWNRLANEMKAISESYLSQAIIIARLMEQSFEFEIGESVDVIKPSYTRNDLSGLLAGDFLLRDIDSFTFLRIIMGQKKQPVKEIISLADRYPVQFLREFQRTGRMGFRTELADFDLNYPGGYQRRIKRVEVVVEGLIGRGGIHGTLTNTGLSLTRTRSGDVKMRLLKPETLLLSRYRIGTDGIVFTPGGEMLEIFENSPVSTSWILDLRPAANDLIYSFITDVKLVLYYESFFDDGLKSQVLEEMAEEQTTTGRRTVALRYEMFDEFFAFQDTGEVSFALRPTMLPFFHTDPRVREMTILIETDEGVSPEDLAVQVSSADGTSAVQATDVDGAISTGPGAGLNAFIGLPLLQEWTVSLPEDLNEEPFASGFQWSDVRNIVLVVEYDFTPRYVPGEPYLLLRDEFERDPMAAFGAIDDPRATSDAPSDWAYNASMSRIEQRSRIHGGAVGPGDVDPDKPGTYLVRMADPAVTGVEDFILVSRMRSAVAGAMGLVFLWQDADNFYFFLMDSDRSYRRLGKKVGGVFQELSTPAVDTARGFIVGQTYTVKVRVQGQSIRLYLNGNLELEGRDLRPALSGQMGFYSWANPGAEFYDIQFIEI